MPAHPSFLKAMPHRKIDLPRGNNLSLPLPSLGFKVKTLQIPGLQSFVTAEHNLTAPSKSSSTGEFCARLLRLVSVQTLRDTYTGQKERREKSILIHHPS